MEKDILHNSLENFSKSAHLDIAINNLTAHQQSGNYDGTLQLTIASKPYHFLFEVKKRLTLSKVLDIGTHLMKQDNLILISDYIQKSVKEYLKNKNISYLDMAGNAFISNKKGIYIYLETNKTSRYVSGKSNRAFTKSGLKVVYQLLINNSIINRPYREIGKAAKVSIDTVGKVIKELLRDKYILRINEHELKLQNKEQLLQEWITIFNKTLRPKLKQRNFKLKNTEIKELLPIALPNSIGGALAADVLSNYLIAENAIIYTSKPFVDIAVEMKLLPAYNGSIMLIEKFWNDEFINNPEITVPPILVYADLLNNPTPRHLETAKIIYDKYVRNTL